MNITIPRLPLPQAWRYRLDITARAVAAMGGGYVLAALASVVLALWLPTSRAEAVTWGMLASFAVYAGAVMWAFAARSAARAWLGLLLPMVLLAVPVALHHWR
ncbi:MAG: DUF3649 domain-containing protein [Pseudomonadota bacterium]|nr:DUF3649 domain-containing protein [Pseudomonadota bacterium]